MLLRDMANILAEFCCRVRAGYQFEPGDVLDDILADGALVRLDLHVDLQFRPVLRVVFQDGQDRWPEDEKCSYGMQPAECADTAAAVSGYLAKEK